MITLINGNIQNCGGLVVPNGSVSFQLNVDATIIVTPFGIVAGGIPINFQFDKNGDLVQPAQLWSNAELNPQNSIGLGTYYLVSFYDANGAIINKVPMWFQFTEADGDTVDLGQVTPFATVGGNVIFYPTSFAIQPPSPTTIGGIFSNAGSPGLFVTAINTNGSVTLSPISFSEITGILTNAQLPSPLIFTATSFSGLVTAQANEELGVIGTTTGQLTFDGGTTGQATITGPAVAGTSTNPFTFSNSINIPGSAAFTINTDTGISRASAGVLDVGNGIVGNASGTVNAAQFNVAGSPIAATNLANGTTGSGSIVLDASPALAGIPTAPTAAALNNSTQLATTAYADAATAVEKARALAAESFLPPVYTAAGVEQTSPHIVSDTATLAGGTVTVTLVGSAAFTSATSYHVVIQEKTTALSTQVTQVSGSSFIITGTGTDVINFIAIGN